MNLKERKVRRKISKIKSKVSRKSDYEKYDMLICMDSWNVRNTMRIIGADKDEKVTKLLSFAGEGGDIADLAMATAVYGYHAKQYFG